MTLADAWQSRSPWRAVPAYLVAQVSGAFGGFMSAHLMFGEPVHLSLTRAAARHSSLTIPMASARPRFNVPLANVNLLFRAFSDRTRLRILHLLREGEVCVGDLVKILKVPQPTASRHLAYLRRAGLVETRKEGLWTYYSLSPAKRPFHRSLLDCLTTCFREVPALEEDTRRYARLKKSGGCCS